MRYCCIGTNVPKDADDLPDKEKEKIRQAADAIIFDHS